VTDPATGRSTRSLARRWLSRRTARALARVLATRADDLIVTERAWKTYRVVTTLDDGSWRADAPRSMGEPHRNANCARVSLP
jgi:hypothetical protein